MTKRLPLALFGLGSWLLPALPSTSAQTPPASASAVARVSLDEALTQLAKIDQDLLAQVEALRKLIDTEVAAKRITEPLAQNLRFTLIHGVTSLAADFNTLLATVRMPAENAALMDGIASLQTAWTNAQTQRTTLMKTATSEAGARTLEALRTARKAADLAPLIGSLERLQEALPPRVASALGSGISAHVTFLRALQRVLEVDSSTVPWALGSALQQLQNTGSSIRSSVSEKDVQERIALTLAPVEKALEEATAALDAHLQGGKPAAEVTAALARFEEAVERNQQARSGLQNSLNQNIGTAAGIYRNFAAVVRALQSGEFGQARNLLSNLRGGNFQALGSAKAATYTSQVAAWEKAMDDGMRQAAEKRRAALQGRLAAIKQPTELEALSAELFQAENENREGRDPDFPRGLAAQLNALAALWTSASPTMLLRQNYNEAEMRFTAAMGDLRKRIERDVLARSLAAPELQQPPLAELSIEAALEKLGAQMAAAGEWRRLLQLVETRSIQSRMDGSMPRENDLATAIRAFLSGQNFELGEQWADAVQSYKSVLRSASDRAPIKEAAARLKALHKEHPEASQPPQAPSPSRGLPPR